MSEHAAKRRRNPRVSFPKPPIGEVGGRYEVGILDLSFGGVRVEHSITLHPSDACVLRIPLKEQSLTLLGRVVWSKPVGRTGEAASQPLFESGVAFDRVSPEAREMLARFLEEAPSGAAWRTLLE
jgi:hypothetical protein